MSLRDESMALLLRLLRLPQAERQTAIARLEPGERLELISRWWMWAHEGQFWPEGDWRVWMIRAGRGFGKTRAGAEWVSHVARGNPDALIALVGATMDDTKRVMVEGPAGLLAVALPGEHPVYRATHGDVTFDSGARAFLFSAEAPEKLRGPQHHAAWCDELGKWRYGAEPAWDNLMLGLRVGTSPQTLVTTTPRPVPLMRRVMAMPGFVETVGATRDNPHLPDSFVQAMIADYAGTRLGRQELEGEMIDDVPGALWTRGLIELCRVPEAPTLARVVVGVDPPASAGGDACGIVCVGLGADGYGYVIEDASVAGLSPEGWAAAVAACAARHGADRVIAERNQGGEMVSSVLHAADAALPVRLVHASHGKVVRAEPVAALYERGRVRHVGGFPALEDELCALTVAGGYAGPGRSPDRADALVYALTALMLRREGRASVRAV